MLFMYIMTLILVIIVLFCIFILIGEWNRFHCEHELTLYTEWLNRHGWGIEADDLENYIKERKHYYE